MPIVSDRLTIREATEPEIDSVLGWTHSLWGDGLDFPAYLARTRELMATPWGQSRYRFVVGINATGTLVTACKRYHLGMRLRGEVIEAVGFGAVFTPDAHRAQGYAAELLARLMATEARRGARMALLYSDIGTAFYERLGFRRLVVERAEAEAIAGPTLFRPLQSREEASLQPWCKEMEPVELEFERSPDYAHFVQQRERPELLAYLPAAGHAEPRGIVAVLRKPDYLWVLQAAYERTVEARDFYGALRCYAQSEGLSRVAGWLPRAAEPAGFQYKPLETAVPMAACLDGGAPPRELSCWSIDHF